MKFYRKHNAFIVESELIVKISGPFSFGKEGIKKAKAAALFPFVFVREEKYATPIFINHELIHFRQQIETLFVGLLLMQFIEDMYSRWFMKLNAEERYLYRAAEQEAYRNQHNLEYLKQRKPFSLFKYILDKKKLEFLESSAPKIILGEKW